MTPNFFSALHLCPLLSLEKLEKESVFSTSLLLFVFASFFRIFPLVFLDISSSLFGLIFLSTTFSFSRSFSKFWFLSLAKLPFTLIFRFAFELSAFSFNLAAILSFEATFSFLLIFLFPNLLLFLRFFLSLRPPTYNEVRNIKFINIWSHVSQKPNTVPNMSSKFSGPPGSMYRSVVAWFVFYVVLSVFLFYGRM